MSIHDPKDSKLIEKMAQDVELRSAARKFFDLACKYRYSYNFKWMGRPIIQFPQDIVAVQELIWEVKPDLIIETGIAHGGSLVLSASILELLGDSGHVLGIDIDIRAHNREAIESHPMSKRITMIQGSSVDEQVLEQVRKLAEGRKKIMVFLDSNHTYEHVSKELTLYSPLVSVGSYLVAFDTVIEDMPGDAFQDRSWAKGNSPKTAVKEFLERDDAFVIEEEWQNKLLLTVAPDGFLKRVK